MHTLYSLGCEVRFVLPLCCSWFAFKLCIWVWHKVAQEASQGAAPHLLAACTYPSSPAHFNKLKINAFVKKGIHQTCHSHRYLRTLAAPIVLETWWSWMHPVRTGWVVSIGGSLVTWILWIRGSCCDSTDWHRSCRSTALAGEILKFRKTNKQTKTKWDKDNVDKRGNFSNSQRRVTIIKAALLVGSFQTNDKSKRHKCLNVFMLNRQMWPK